MKFFVVLRKEIQLIYDCICQPRIVLENLEGRENLLIKPIFLSLNDIADINNEILNETLQNLIQTFHQHFT